MICDAASETKFCGYCKQTKQITDFYKSRHGTPRTYCKKCNTALANEWNRKNKDRHIANVKGWQAKNAPRRREHDQKYRLNRSPEQKARDQAYNFHWKIQRKYGLTRVMWDEMLAQQNGLCALCQKREMDVTSGKLNVDHCHDTGTVRGLLCRHCNTALGILGDTVESIERVLSYLRGDLFPRKIGAGR